MKKLALILAVLSGYFAPTVCADELWKCKEPVPPVRFATTDEEKEEPPPCEKWVKVRGVTERLVARIMDRRFTNATDFAGEVAASEGQMLPDVSTEELYAHGQMYFDVHGLESVEVNEAPLGSLLIYDGLAGVLVEVQEEVGGEWGRAVIYPSAELNYELNISDPLIYGKGEPVAIVWEDPSAEG